MVANGQLETPSSTVDFQIEVGDVLFKERFIAIANLRNMKIALFFLKRNSTILDMRQGVLNFIFVPCNSTMQTTRTLTLTNLY